MANKKEFTVEELTKQCEEAKKNFETLNAQLKQAKQDEENRRKAELALEKDNRKKEVDDAITNVKDLLEAYIKDYGSYSSEYNGDEYIPIKRIFPWWF